MKNLITIHNKLTMNIYIEKIDIINYIYNFPITKREKRIFI